VAEPAADAACCQEIAASAASRTESPGPRAWTRDHGNAQNKASDLQLCRAAYRNRTDDLRITRRITAVHSCSDDHTCPARATPQSSCVRGCPRPLLANPLARLIPAAAPTAPHPGRAGSAPSGATRPARVRPMMPVMRDFWLQHAFQVCAAGSGAAQEGSRPRLLGLGGARRTSQDVDE
jgi:hypothetical protein